MLAGGFFSSGFEGKATYSWSWKKSGLLVFMPAKLSTRSRIFARMDGVKLLTVHCGMLQMNTGKSGKAAATLVKCSTLASSSSVWKYGRTTPTASAPISLACPAQIDGVPGGDVSGVNDDLDPFPDLLNDRFCYGLPFLDAERRNPHPCRL